MAEVEISYTFRAKGVGEVEVTVCQKSDGTPVAILPLDRDEWLDGDLSDLYKMLPLVLAKMEEIKAASKAEQPNPPH